MNRVPLVVVAVMVAMVAVAAMLRLQARGATAGAHTRGLVQAAPLDAGKRAPFVPATGVTGSVRARMQHEDARHTHRAAGQAPMTREVMAVWTHDVGAPIEAQVVTSPDGQTLYVAALDGSLTALARADGSTKWKFDLGDRAYATPAVADDGTLYAGSDAKKLLALSPEGKPRWTFDAEDEVDSGIMIAQDGTVIFAAGRRVYGLTPHGILKFRATAKRKVFASPAVAADGRTFFGSQDHHVYALTPQGGPAWSTDLGADVDGAPALSDDDGAVFVGTDDGEIVRLDAADGHVVWRTNVGGYVRGTLSMTREGEIAAGVYGPMPREVLLGPEDGAVRVTFPIQGTGGRDFGVHGGALEDDHGRLLFGAQDDVVRAIDHGGQVAWSFTTGGDVDAPLTLLEDGRVVFGSDDGKVYLLAGK